MIHVCIYMYTSMTQLAIFNASKAYGPECNSNRCTQRWCYPQQLCKGNGLGICRGVVAAAVPMAGSVVSNVCLGVIDSRTC